MILGSFLSCKDETTKYKEGNSLTSEELTKSNFRWSQVAGSPEIKVYYLQLNFLNFPHEYYLGKTIVDFTDPIPNNGNGDQNSAIPDNTAWKHSGNEHLMVREMINLSS